MILTSQPQILTLKRGELEESPRHDVDVLSKSTDDTGRDDLVCAVCKHRITSSSLRRAVEGQHRHTRINPHGYEHHFACFRTARGCVPVGKIVQFYSWFSGYSWQMAHCGNCSIHLGWLFHGEHDRFYGLLVDGLIESETPESPADG